MKISNNDRRLLREAVNIKINELETAITHKDKIERLIIPKDSIEMLLFNEHIDKDGKVYKTIGYFYDNLRYIDLSEVSFEDVSFDFRSYKDGNDKQIIKLGGINAKIDFMKSYEMRKFGHLVLSNISFYGLDLSKNNYNDEHGVSVFHNAHVVNCEFGHTNLKITTPEVHFYDSSLYGVDLSELEMYPDDALKTFNNCDLKYTGLKIKIDDTVNPDSIKSIMNSPKFEGCFVGKTKITSKNEKQEKAEILFYDYEAWRDAMIDDICSDLDKQVNGSKKNTLKKEYDPLEPKLPFEI